LARTAARGRSRGIGGDQVLLSTNNLRLLTLFLAGVVFEESGRFPLPGGNFVALVVPNGRREKLTACLSAHYLVTSFPFNMVTSILRATFCRHLSLREARQNGFG